jgi:hypothetical protein
MRLTRGWSLFLLAFGVWSWIIWPTFLKNIWKDDRSWHDGPTGFFLVHLVLTVVSLTLGTIVGYLGWRGYRAARQGGPDAEPQSAPQSTDRLAAPVSSRS